jgi:hypothetical protein
VYKRVAGTTERYEILKHIVGRSFPVLDVVHVATPVGRSTPSASPSVALVYSATEGLGKSVVSHQSSVRPMRLFMASLTSSIMAAA